MAVNLPDPLEGCSPVLREKVARILAAMAALGFPMKVIAGNRTTEQQQLLYAQGRTVPGKIVTYADGLRVRSNHQGGKAADLCFQGPKPFAESHPWDLYGAMVESLGLKWGGRWKKPHDRPHCELP